MIFLSFLEYESERVCVYAFFITLPAFYTNYVEGSQLGCANDVARELIKLKRDSIDGLIVFVDVLRMF